MKSLLFHSVFTLLLVAGCREKDVHRFELTGAQPYHWRLFTEKKDIYALVVKVDGNRYSAANLILADDSGLATKVKLTSSDTSIRLDWYSPVCDLRFDADSVEVEASLTGSITFY